MPIGMTERSRPMKTRITRGRMRENHPEVGWRETHGLDEPESSLKWEGRQFTVSEGHAKSHDGKYHVGGPFHTVKAHHVIGGTQVSNLVAFIRDWRYDGMIYTPVPGARIQTQKDLDAHRSQDHSDLDSDGATAISLCSPINPHSNLATQLGELLSDGIKRSLPGVATWKERNRVAKAAGGEYLSAQFGWLPLVDEVKNTSRTISHSGTYLNQYDHGAGRNTHREFEFPTESHSESSEAAGYALLAGVETSPWMQAVAPRLTTTVETVTRKWFSGSFTYPSMPDSDTLGKMKYAVDRSNSLLGTTLTPNVMWELTPWSWAVDWFSNTGDVINNATNFAINGLVMRYGYMMEESTMTITNSLSRSGLGSTWEAGVPGDSKLIITSKIRSEANPFGFGLTWDGLSPTQMLIAAALGITHLR